MGLKKRIDDMQEKAVGEKTRLRRGAGRIFEKDGTAAFVPMGLFVPAFTVTIADVTHLSETKGGKSKHSYTMHVFSGGNEIASYDNMAIGETKILEEWFRAHPDFGKNSALASAAPASVADELAKLVALRDSGVLTAGEFDAQKARLLG